MFRRPRRRAKRQLWQRDDDHGALQSPPGSWDETQRGWASYGLDFGSLAAVVGCLLVPVIFGLTRVSRPEKASPQTASVPADPNPTPLTTAPPLSLDELLRAIKHRLNLRGIPTEVDPSQNLLRVLTHGPMHPLSKASLDERIKPRIPEVSAVLAWAVRCHVDFEAAPTLRPVSDPALCPSTNTNDLSELAQANCLVGRGRLSVHSLRFEGHSDGVPFRANPKGPFRDNLSLSVARAKILSDQINTCIQNHPLRSRLSSSYQGYGDSHPKVSNALDPKNRRVEIRFQVNPDAQLDADLIVN
jgi:hypothetical protein